MKHAEYLPLDVETNSPFYPGFKSIEEFELESKNTEAQGRKKRIIVTCCILGSVFTVLLTLAVFTTQPYDVVNSGPYGFSANISSDSGSAADQSIHPLQHGVWDDGTHGNYTTVVSNSSTHDFIPCSGSNLKCSVVNKLPLPEVDYRNLSRRVEASHGLVAADSSRCSQIGRDVLSRHDGNAVDAAVAVALCQGIVNPMASGLGGGAFITIRLANGTDLFVDARETAPLAANATMFAGLPEDASWYGPLAVAVPGELHGLAEIHKRFGKVSWAQLVAPAATLAREGFAAHPYLVYSMSGPRNYQKISSTPELREAFFIPAENGSWRLPQVGELCCKRPKLAETLDNIAADPGYLSRPDVAAAMAAELAAQGGIITAEDFETVKPAVREPLRVQLGDLELLVPPPPSSAAVVAFALKFLVGYGNTLINSSSSSSDSSMQQPLASFGIDAQRDGGLGLHRLIEAMKHGFAIRTALGDPGTPDQPRQHADSINAVVADLLSDDFIDSLRALTRDDEVLDDRLYGGRWNPEGVAPANESGTSHFCVVDKERNAVSVTTSVNGPYGAGIISQSTGILWGNTMDDFAQPNRTSIITPHPAEANFIGPGKRPLSAMSPIIVSHKPTGRLVAVAGASGGPLIVSATLQTLARLLLEGADVADAVSKPRLHDQLLPSDNAFYENYTWGYTQHQLPASVVEYLKSRGQVPATYPVGLGISQAISVSYSVLDTTRVASGTDSKDGVAQQIGMLVGQSDSRKDGAPAGY